MVTFRIACGSGHNTPKFVTLLLFYCAHASLMDVSTHRTMNTVHAVPRWQHNVLPLYCIINGFGKNWPSFALFVNASILIDTGRVDTEMFCN